MGVLSMGWGWVRVEWWGVSERGCQWDRRWCPVGLRFKFDSGVKGVGRGPGGLLSLPFRVGV